MKERGSEEQRGEGEKDSGGAAAIDLDLGI